MYYLDLVLLPMYLYLSNYIPRAIQVQTCLISFWNETKHILPLQLINSFLTWQNQHKTQKDVIWRCQVFAVGARNYGIKDILKLLLNYLAFMLLRNIYRNFQRFKTFLSIAHLIQISIDRFWIAYRLHHYKSFLTPLIWLPICGSFQGVLFHIKNTVISAEFRCKAGP